MGYESSLTFNVQYYMDQVMAKKLHQAQDYWQIRSSAQAFRRFLCDPETVNTPDFVIRRYIQTHRPEILPRDMELEDLTDNTNLPWSREVIDLLSKSLWKLSQSQGAKMERKEWVNYLSGKGISDRRKLFMIAFTLMMDQEATVELMLACGMEPYSSRDPLDLICLFCQKQPGRYTWAQALAGLEVFLQARSGSMAEAAQPTSGMTEQLSSDLEEIFQKGLPDYEALDALIDYMVSHASEFAAVTKTVTKGGKKEQRVSFLPGYSLNRVDCYARLSQYLRVLYPTYLLETRKKSKENNDTTGPKEVAVETDERGIPHLPSLVRAMLYANNWSGLEWDTEMVYGDDPEYTAQSREFEGKMQNFWDNYPAHVMKIQRLLTGGDNVAFYERRDALLMIYFLIDGYRKLCENEDGQEAMEQLDILRQGESVMDEALDEVLEKVEYLYTNYTQDEDLSKKVSMLRTCFELVLTTMGYQGLYLPAIFDRLFFAALLSETPEIITPLIISQGER